MDNDKFRVFVEQWQSGVFFKEFLITLYLTIVSTIFAYLIGSILGIVLYLTNKGGIKENKVANKILGVIVNIIRSIPFFIFMFAMVPVNKFLIGTVSGNEAMIITLIFASAPFVARMVESSLNEVNHGIIEAAEAMGANTFEIVFKVVIPEALPSLILGLVISTITILGYSAMASSIGAGGLGSLAKTYGYTRYNTYIMWSCIILMIIIVQVIQELGSHFAKRIDKR